MEARRRHFDRIWAGRELRPATATVSRAAVIAPHVKAGRRLLDLGGGAGLSAVVLGDRCAQVVVVDLAARPLRAAAEAGAQPTQADFAATDLPFATASFEVVLCLAALQYADDPRAVIEEMQRVLRPGGQLGLIVPNMRFLLRAAKLVVLGRFPKVSSDPGYDGGTRHYFCASDIKELMARAGLEVTWQGGHIPRPAVARWLPEQTALLRQFKAEFFCAEMIIMGEKRIERMPATGA